MMRVCRSPATARIALLVLGLALSATRPAGATGVDVDVSLGFSDTFRPGRWTPVTVTAANRGPNLVGELEVLSTEGDEFRSQRFGMRWQRRLELDRGARKRFHFTVFVASLSRPLAVRVSAGGRELARRVVDLRRQQTADRLLLVLSRDANLDRLNDAHGRSLRVLYPHPGDLPRRWIGYDGVSAVVLHGLSLERLEPEQFEALQRWLANGGILAVSGGPDYALLRSPRAAAVLPAVPLGTVAVADAAAVGRALGAPLAGDHDFLVHRVAAGRGRVLHRVGDLPLVLERRVGRGRVVYLTFDVARQPFVRWPPMTEIWQRILSLPPGRWSADSRPEAAATKPVTLLLGSIGSGFPSHGTVLLFIALYLLTLATVQRAGATADTRWRRLRAHAAWGLPVAFAGASWLMFSSLLHERGAGAAVVSVVEPLVPSPFARVSLDLGLYGTRRVALRMEYDGAAPAFRVPARAAAGAESWVLRETVPRVLEAEHGRAFALHLLEGRDVVPYAITAAVADASGGVRLEVQNDSGRALRDAWLVLRGAAYSLGDIDAEARLRRVLDPARDGVVVDPAIGPTVFPPRRGRDAAAHDAARAALARALARLPGESPAGPADALLVARTASPLRLAGRSARWVRHELALVLMRVPVAGAREGRPR